MSATQVKEPQFRHVCLTLNNYSVMEYEELIATKCSYLVVGKEVGEQGTPHLQAYIEFGGGKRLSTLKKMWPRAHIEKRKGTPEQAAAYCKKDNNFIETGEISKQGQRTDLTTAQTEIMTGEKTVEEIRQEDPFFFHQYGRTLNALEDDFNRRRRRNKMTKGVWLWGPTGTGKSDIAFNYDNDTLETHYLYNTDETFQNGYNGQKYCLLDEFRGELKFRELLKLCDKHNSMKVPIKGRDPLPFTSEYVIITSAKSPEDIYMNKLSGSDSIEQFYRRFKIFKLPEQRQEAADYCQVKIPDEYATAT